MFDDLPENAFADGHPSQVEWFDHDEVDRLMGNIELEPHEVRTQAAQLFERIMLFCWTQSAHSAFVKFTALTAALRPDLITNANYQRIGASIGVSRQRLSIVALEFQKAFGIQCARSCPAKAEARLKASKANASSANAAFTK